MKVSEVKLLVKTTICFHQHFVLNTVISICNEVYRFKTLDFLYIYKNIEDEIFGLGF